MSKLRGPLVCAQCASEKAIWTEDCSHAREPWKDGYSSTVRERKRTRLTSEDVGRAIINLSPSWENFYHLAADNLNRVVDEKHKHE